MFEIGTKVVDQDGFEGVVVNVTVWENRIWYDVRLKSGVVVRYPKDLKKL